MQEQDEITVFEPPVAVSGAVLFVEIVDFGKDAKSAVISGDEQLQLESIATLARGQVFSRPDGELSVYIDDPDRALETAVHCLEMVAAWRRADTSREGLLARIVAGYGPVSLSGDHLAGDWTAELPRLVRYVPASSIGMLSSLYKILGDTLSVPPTEVIVEGVHRDVLYVCKVDERGAERSDCEDAAVIDLSAMHWLKLRIRGHTRTLRPEDCPLIFGRDPDCQIVLLEAAASRRHGRIEYRGNRFHCIDSSRNGTYIENTGGRELLIRDDGLVLHGSGSISPGSPVGKHTADLISFSTEFD